MKKFFAALMVVFMMLCAVQAYAAETSGTGSFNKRYTGALPVGDVLEFKATFIKEMVTGETLETMDDPGLIGDIEHVVVSDSDMINAVEYTYTKPDSYGSYVYEITEIDPEIEGDKVTYDTGAIYIMVNYLVIDGEEVLNSSVCSDPNGVAATAEDSEDEDAKADQFVNAYAVGGFDISKTVTGNAAVKNDRFNVKVTFTSGRDLENVSITYKNSAENETNTSLITSFESGVTYDVIVEIGDGETIAFDGVPQGIDVTVTETNQTGHDDLNKYEAKYNGNDAPAEFEVGETDQTVAIVNTKSAIIPTGVYMDYIPYVVLLAAAVVAIVIIAAKRRAHKRDDD